MSDGLVVGRRIRNSSVGQNPVQCRPQNPGYLTALLWATESEAQAGQGVAHPPELCHLAQRLLGGHLRPGALSLTAPFHAACRTASHCVPHRFTLLTAPLHTTYHTASYVVPHRITLRTASFRTASPCPHTRAREHTRTCTCIHVRVHVHTHARAHTRTCTHAHMRMHTHMRMHPHRTR